MFSARVPRALEPNRITQAVRRARTAGRSLLDLTLTNPTTAGFRYSPATLNGLASPAALQYEPQPFGLLHARQAVASDYARRGLDATPDRIVLTASTSEAYSLLFKLLCQPHGDAVMVPVPSYPLFDHLTALDGVRSIPYRLDYHGRWTMTIEDVERRWTDQVRGVLAVSPNNPTGSVLSPAELEALSTLCAERDAALIIDEVFADYVLDGSQRPEARGQGPDVDSIPQRSRGPTSITALGAPPPSAAARASRPRRLKAVARTSGALTFRLGGLSKSAGLPQVKLGWILIDGPEGVVREAIDRLEVMCDAYLSVSTPVQVAAPDLIEAGASVRAQILDRVRMNYRALISAASHHPAIEVLPTEAGWSSVLRVPSTRTEEDLVVDLLEHDGVLVHPGFFFDFAHEAFLVLSLLAETEAFDEGVRRVLERADG